MIALPELQQAFADAVFGRSETLLRHVEGGTFEPARHLQIYRNNVFATLTGALADIYPVVQRLVGRGFFEFAADTYIRTHPPAGGNLHGFGERFPHFLREFEPARTLAYVGDVARLEWAWHRAFHAAEAASLSTEALARVDPPRYPHLRFVLHPSVSLVESAYPLLRIWQVNQPNYPDEPVIDLDAGGVKLLIVRRGLTVEIETLTRGEFTLLSSLADERRLEQAVMAALAAQPDFDLHHTLRYRIADQTIVDFSND